MPCRDYDQAYLDKMREDNSRSDIAKLKKRNDDLAILLCESCQIVTDNNLRESMSKPLKDWWWQHSKAERKK